jgi:hypothetical protein
MIYESNFFLNEDDYGYQEDEAFYYQNYNQL